MLSIRLEAVISAEAAAVWRAWKPSFPIRPREEESRNLDLYRLAYGVKVPVTLVEVNEMRNWTVEHALPRGKLVIDHWMVPLSTGQVRVGKRYDVHGPMTIVYRLFIAPGIRRSLPGEFAALERRARASDGSEPAEQATDR